jgi:hypothetical protein
VSSDGGPYSVTYNVDVTGTATDFYFQSGTLLGSGATDGTRATYVTEGSCRWF